MRSCVQGFLCVVVALVLLCSRSAVPAAEGTVAGDVNCDGRIDLADAIYTLNWLFLGGPDLCPIPDGPGLRAEIAELEAALGAKTEEAEQCQAALVASQAEAIAALQDLLGCRTDLAEQEATLRVTTEELAACNGDLQETRAERDNLAADLQATEAELAAAETARDLCQATLAQVNPELATCVANLAATETSLATCTSTQAATAEQLAATQDALAAAQARIAELESGAALATALARIEELEVPGCMDPAAANYNCHANVADGSCQYPGCTDPAAQNYDPHANVNDGTCRYPCTTDCPTIPGFTLLGNNEQRYAEYVHDQTGIVFVLLPGGTFMMGSPEDEPGRNTDEGPLHQVTLSPFLIGKYELMQHEWQAVTGLNPSAYRGDNRPVERVSWVDCQAFCAQTGLMLPSEAQWEYACRARTNGLYAGTGILEEMGWYSGNSGGHTHDVGEKRPNGFGLYDMHGNVFELCRDQYYQLFYATPEAVQADPVNLTYGSDCVTRGGAYDFFGIQWLRSGCRYVQARLSAYPYYGVRLAYWPLP